MMQSSIRYVSLIMVIIVAFISIAYAGEKKDFKPYVGTKQFEQLKSLAGTWEGRESMGDPNKTISVTYESSSGGSAVIETLFPGTAHEMVTVYYERGGKLTMTHYCMLGNQPQMDLSKASGKELYFTLAPQNTINTKTESHMNNLTLTFVDANHLTHRWGFYENGKQAGVNEITLTRKN